MDGQTDSSNQVTIRVEAQGGTSGLLHHYWEEQLVISAGHKHEGRTGLAFELSPTEVLKVWNVK